MKISAVFKGLILLVTISGVSIPIAAQQATQATETRAPQAPSPAPAPRVTSQAPKRTYSARVTQRPLVLQGQLAAPQVVTLVHRLSGLKLFRLLLRSGDVTAIARLDENFTFRGDVHTNVVAGLALDDGETVAVWLPEVDAELGPPLPPTAPNAPGTPPASTTGQTTNVPALRHYSGTWFESPDLTLLARDRKTLAAKYVGLDGVTGLSVLKFDNKTPRIAFSYAEAEEKSIKVGQRVHLFTPEPINDEVRVGPIQIRLGKIEAEITNLLRAPSGGIARLEIKSPKISVANIGGVALTENGETLGIIDAVKGNEGTILPASLIKGATKRVLARQASVPRPWLGIRGTPLESFAFEQLLRTGWESQMAQALAADRLGILLTSVTPNSPASTAALRPGDVILRVNDGEVRSVEDFSWMLEEAGPGGLLRFTVARPGKTSPEAVEVKLSEAPDPFFGLRAPQLPSAAVNVPGVSSVRNYSLLAGGLETIAIRPKVASRLGSSGGLLVVSVGPATAAFKAGLRVGDVIEAINGKALSANAEAARMLSRAQGSYSFTVVRNKQRLLFTVVTD
ncbi:MAG TPA: PDZ domain-containing protein [Pyrinomonadaceae bacterium]|nr:PDZ domain-containing protein [Pyrinomonadaceae bacterium]